MGCDWRDAPGFASSVLTIALGAIVVSGSRAAPRVAAFGLLIVAATLVAPFLVDLDGLKDPRVLDERRRERDLRRLFLSGREVPGLGLRDAFTVLRAYRAAARFEPDADLAADPRAVGPVQMRGTTPGTPPPPPKPAAPAEEAPDDYTSRLLWAKKQVWKDRATDRGFDPEAYDDKK